MHCRVYAGDIWVFYGFLTFYGYFTGNFGTPSSLDISSSKMESIHFRVASRLFPGVLQRKWRHQKPSENLRTSCAMSMAGASINGYCSSTLVAFPCLSRTPSLPRCSSYMSLLTSNVPRHHREMGWQWMRQHATLMMTWPKSVACQESW